MSVCDMRFRFQLKGKALVSATAICVVVLFTVISCLLTFDPKILDHSEEQHQEHEKNEDHSELPKQTTRVVSTEIETYIKAPGTIDFHPKHALRIHPSFPGIIVRVHKDLGDVVKQGDVLAILESNIGLQTVSISSPVDGIVLSKNVVSGQSVVPEEDAFSVGNTSILQAKFDISARDIKKIKLNQKVVIVSEYESVVRASLQFVSPILSDDTRASAAFADLRSQDLRPGMFVTGAIVVSTTQVEKSIPASFCENDLQTATLQIISDLKIEKRSVTFGKRDYQNCEVLAGLQVGDEVISTEIASRSTNTEGLEGHDDHGEEKEPGHAEDEKEKYDHGH